MIQVHNLNGTSGFGPSPGHEAWKDWWEDCMGREFFVCASFGCENMAEVGAHVQKYNHQDRSWYIVPLCKACNNRNCDEQFYVNKSELAPVK